MFQQNSSSKLFFSALTNSIINPISFLPMPNVKLCLSYSWLRAESVGFGQKDVNWGMLGYGWPSCVPACSLIKRLSTPCVWPKTRSSRAGSVLYINYLWLSSAFLLKASDIPDSPLMKGKHLVVYFSCLKHEIKSWFKKCFWLRVIERLCFEAAPVAVKQSFKWIGHWAQFPKSSLISSES